MMDAKHPHEQPTPASKDEPVQFDPSRMIGIIKRKALIKELADAYHNECLAYCQELLQLQRKWEEQQYIERKTPEDARKQVVTKPKPSKRPKKRL
ncbi:uncharacterized protein [Elaeis guineensis]|uniref:Uncharacterized protein LOC105059039 isoform X1 n=1 Tax=Elaeis guineensis var. tenera TaxID=51953 RepID=A0A6I9SBM7_ELAGV|nr:uncharacterized protein LOC105059039 isoform X1 [Elaeis guineensis]